MRKIVPIVMLIVMSLELSGCFAVAVGAAGAGGGYIYKDREDEGKAP